MNEQGIITESGAVRFVRRLKAPIDRVWAHLVDPELRALWFAGGDTDQQVGGTMILRFRNSALAPAGEAMPERFAQYEGMESKSEIVEIAPPHLLVFSWMEEEGPPSQVRWELETAGEETIFTLTHSRLANAAAKIDVSGGWHLHLDLLEAKLDGLPSPPFWSRQAALEESYRALISE